MARPAISQIDEPPTQATRQGFVSRFTSDGKETFREYHMHPPGV